MDTSYFWPVFFSHKSDAAAVNLSKNLIDFNLFFTLHWRKFCRDNGGDERVVDLAFDLLQWVLWYLIDSLICWIKSFIFQPMILIKRRGDFVSNYWLYALIYRPLSYLLRYQNQPLSN